MIGAMAMRILILGIVGFFSAAFLFLPQEQLRGFFRLKQPSRLWARIIGLMGLLWVALAAADHADARFFDLPSQTRALLDTTRYYIGGTLIGLLFALSTKKREGCGDA